MEESDCPAGHRWFSCANGVTGCCYGDECLRREGCPSLEYVADAATTDSTLATSTSAAAPALTVAEPTESTATPSLSTIDGIMAEPAESTTSTEPSSTTVLVVTKSIVSVTAAGPPSTTASTATEPTESTTDIEPSSTRMSTETAAETTTAATPPTVVRDAGPDASATSTPRSETTGTQPISDSTEDRIHDHNNGKLIGAIVGGVIGLLLILCHISYLLYRLRKQRGKRRFTLLHWHHHRLDHPENAAEAGDIVTPLVQVQRQPSSGAAGSATGQPRHQLQSIPEDRSLGVSPLQGHTDSRIIPSASLSSSPNISPQTASSSLDPSKARLIPNLSAVVHPALRHHQLTSQPTAISHPKPITIPKRATSHPRTRIPSSPRELFDTGFRLGRLELPAFSTRELINIPFAERQRQKQQKHLRRTSKMRLPIVTRDGATVSATFDTLPSSPDPHAISFVDHGPASPSATRKRPKSQSSSTSSSRSSPLSSPPPSYRSSWRRGSSEVKEKVMEKFRRKS